MGLAVAALLGEQVTANLVPKAGRIGSNLAVVCSVGQRKVKKRSQLGHYLPARQRSGVGSLGPERCPGPRAARALHAHGGMKRLVTLLLTMLLALAACAPTQDAGDDATDPATIPSASPGLDDNDDDDNNADDDHGASHSADDDDGDDTDDDDDGSPSASPSG